MKTDIKIFSNPGRIEYYFGSRMICVYDNGSVLWYENGQLHRVDGPAAIYSDGSTEWLQNGKLHREDGPAVEWASGGKEWYLNGVHVKKSNRT